MQRFALGASNFLIFYDLIGEPDRMCFPKAHARYHRSITKRGATYIFSQWRTSPCFSPCLGFAQACFMPKAAF